MVTQTISTVTADNFIQIMCLNKKYNIENRYVSRVDNIFNAILFV